jgi:hypothetical protein
MLCDNTKSEPPCQHLMQPVARKMNAQEAQKIHGHGAGINSAKALNGSTIQREEGLLFARRSQDFGGPSVYYDESNDKR